MTYHLVPAGGHNKGVLMMPDFVLFIDPLSSMNFELLFVEIKRRGNFANGNQESDLIKLGKQMQVALNKMVLKKVQSPEVVGLLVQGTDSIPSDISGTYANS